MALRPIVQVACNNCELVQYGLYDSFPNQVVEGFRSNGICRPDGLGGCTTMGSCGVGVNITIFNNSPSLTFYANFAGRGCNTIFPSTPFIIGVVDAVGVACDGQLHTALDRGNNLVPLEVKWYPSLAQCTTNSTPFLISSFKVRCNLCG